MLSFILLIHNARMHERTQQERRPHTSIVLRSSNIIGGAAPFLGQTKFLQWLDEKLKARVLIYHMCACVRVVLCLCVEVICVSSCLDVWEGEAT